ncbi:helix-turn-helix transcriptional regulator [Methylobacterium sp. JK268]
MGGCRLDRTRKDLAEFLRTKRAALAPESLGLPRTPRRRTPGLRREELAAMAGIGLTWYTWLEQGRAIAVSSHVLDRIARILRLDEVERRHLFLLAQQRPPAASGATTWRIPDLVRVLLDDLGTRPAYVFNLRWDVLAWNRAAALVFGFEIRPPEERNMLRMLFDDERLSGRIAQWEEQAPLVVASFRRDLAQAPEDPAMLDLVAALEGRSALFRTLWASQSVRGRCRGRRVLSLDGTGPVAFTHATLIVDAEEHLRLALYAAMDARDHARFAALCGSAGAG